MSSPIHREADRDPVVVLCDGDTFVIQPIFQWQLPVIESFGDGRIIAATKALLGNDQWRQFKRRKQRKAKDVKELLTVVMREFGMEIETVQDVARVLTDYDLVPLLEADLRSEYGVVLRDLYQHNTTLSLRELCSMVKGLSDRSRLKVHLQGESAALDYKEHLMLEVLDLLSQISYFGQVEAFKGVSSNASRQKIMSGRPKRLPRPGAKEPKKRFSTTEELARALGAKVKITVPQQ